MSGRDPDGEEPTGRGQANLVALATALVVLTAVLGSALAVADGALASADRDPAERRAAVAAGERLVAADAPVTRRANVLDAGTVGTLDATRLARLVPPLDGTAFRVRLGDETLAERGDPTGGATVRRLVLVSTATERTVDVAADRPVSLPRRTARVRLDFSGTNVTTVRANGRVVLHRPGGLRGAETVAVSRLETARLRFGDGATGTVGVTYYPERTRKATLAVTVDA
ncbi:DUF7263 family protein [Candidatus Halobonum tyrrellensis]|uniref:Uncharacterized protein n=1 Tax=Candidatus Halobonum tyrrellensis G22 TaxID=1324957 RepID=V4HDF5_9EURY|nr:hypothetical protein [Candidatus Halobonum tyrrellensis]ESP88103.1 hypothetical protein K933_10447 [Candidatus Halobonum tyrrellensis G22]